MALKKKKKADRSTTHRKPEGKPLREIFVDLPEDNEAFLDLKSTMCHCGCCGTDFEVYSDCPACGSNDIREV